MATRTISRWWRRTGSPDPGFRYHLPDGTGIQAAEALERIEGLVIPPAWRDVHIAPGPGCKVQAFGWDEAGRKQYIYSRTHVARQRRRKWQRVLELGRVLPELRAVTNRDLRRRGLGRDKVVATVVRLVSRACFRAGSERYAVENRTFGICTLGKRHLAVRGNDLVFTYRGKRRIHQRVVVADTPLVKVIQRIVRLRGPRLFQYEGEDGRVHPVTATDVNAYLRDALGQRFTSKDIRTFGGTVRAAVVLSELGPAASPGEAHRSVVLCCRLVAAELGNTPAVCRSAYVHPAVLEQYERRGRTIEPLMRKAPRPVTAQEPPSYYPEEGALIRFLQKYG